MAPTSTLLSKSRVLTGMQCPKALWLHVYRPELAAPASAAQQAIFEQGHEVGLEARKRFPGGVEIADVVLANAIAATQRAIISGAHTIYEATFAHEDILVRVDVLHRVDRKSPWSLIEVKSTTSVKNQHVADVAVQALVVAGVGLHLDRLDVMHLNKECHWPDEQNLFALVDVRDRVAEVHAEISTTIASLKTALKVDQPPAHDIGAHCNRPYPCVFQHHCWSGIPSPSVFDLPGFSATAWELYHQGIVRLDDPRIGTFEGTRLHQAKATQTKSRWIDSETIRSRLAEWVWPLYFVDFETIGYALPKIGGTRPFQQVPFQFSVHVQAKPGSPTVHQEYLHPDASDPRPGIAAALCAAIGPVGSVVAYNKSFEAGCLEDLADRLPGHAGVLRDIASRLVDPLPIVREAVYDHQFQGSFSLKSIAPALLGDRASYAGLEVADGGAAQRAFVAMIAIDTADAARARLQTPLLAYCRKDTQVMVDLVAWLYEKAAN